MCLVPLIAPARMSGKAKSRVATGIFRWKAKGVFSRVQSLLEYPHMDLLFPFAVARSFLFWLVSAA